MELREVIDKLFEMTDKQRLEVFNISRVEDVLDSRSTNTIIKRVEEFYSEPKYGDIYVGKTLPANKCVFLGEDSSDKYWLLFNGLHIPQQYSQYNFKRYYSKTGKNIANELNGFFE